MASPIIAQLELNKKIEQNTQQRHEERIAVESERIEVEKQRLAFERQRLDLEQSRGWKEWLALCLSGFAIVVSVAVAIYVPQAVNVRSLPVNSDNDLVTTKPDIQDVGECTQGHTERKNTETKAWAEEFE